MNAIKPLNTYKQSSMSEQQTMLFLRILTSPFKSDEITAMVHDIHTEGGFVPKVFMSRLRWAGLVVANLPDHVEKAEKEGKELPTVNLDPHVYVFLLATGNVMSPGDSTLYVHAIYHHYKRLFGDDKSAVYTFRHFVDLFPMGFPDDDAKLQCWDAQKGDTVDNLLDSEAFFNVWAPQATAN